MASIDQDAVTRFADQLDLGSLDDAPNTYLPTVLPLALPTPLHTVNFFTVLHLVYDTLVSPVHTAYFLEAKTSARDTAIRGCVSLFLGSEEEWTTDNLLSTAAWRNDKLDERAVAEHFEIQVVREKQHETMKAVRVGERWDKAVAVAAELVMLFAELGGRLGGKCMGEAVVALVKDCRQSSDSDAKAFAEAFTHQAAQLIPTLLSSEPLPFDALPSAPLHLLQDLAYRQTDSADLDLSLPPQAELADVSPLPLPIPLLLHRGIITSPDLQGLDAGNGVTEVQVSPGTMKDLEKSSLEASVALRVSLRTRSAGVTYHDVWRVCALLEERMLQQGHGVQLVLS